MSAKIEQQMGELSDKINEIVKPLFIDGGIDELRVTCRKVFESEEKCTIEISLDAIPSKAPIEGKNSKIERCTCGETVPVTNVGFDNLDPFGITAAMKEVSKAMRDAAEVAKKRREKVESAKNHESEYDKYLRMDFDNDPAKARNTALKAIRKLFSQFENLNSRLDLIEQMVAEKQ